MTEQSHTVAWTFNKNIEREFLEAGGELIIRIKDGYKFFEANRETLKARFADPGKRTTVIILHPDSPYMGAVASMDDKKRGYPESQASDCRRAVMVLQSIRHELIAEGKGDCAERTVFRGADDVPTTVCFINDNSALLDIYKSYAVRGELLRLVAKKDDPVQEGKTGEWNVYAMLKQECDVILGQTQPERNNLWGYRLPDRFEDLRRQ